MRLRWKYIRLIFLAAIVAVMAPFLAGYGLLVPIAALYVAALVALAVAVLPMGRRALPAG